MYKTWIFKPKVTSVLRGAWFHFSYDRTSITMHGKYGPENYKRPNWYPWTYIPQCGRYSKKDPIPKDWRHRRFILYTPFGAIWLDFIIDRRSYHMDRAYEPFVSDVIMCHRYYNISRQLLWGWDLGASPGRTSVQSVRAKG